MFTRNKNGNVHELIMKQLADVKSCLSSFEDFMRITTSDDIDADALRNLCDTVYEKEHLADITLRAMIDSLASTMFLPSTREDLISIATSCDKIANKCEDICYMVVLQNFRFPKDYNEDVMEIMALTHKQFELLEKSISLLFTRMGDLMKDQSILDEIRDYESQTDFFERKLLEKTYSENKDLAQCMQLSTFISDLCDITDIVENIADKIQIMLVTRKA
jgi:predicted phosphate transport protein (TIGR00153 family)